MSHQPIRIETSPKRVRAVLDGVVVADSKRPALVWEWPYYPTYYFPESDIRPDALSEREAIAEPTHLGTPTEFDVAAGDRLVEAGGYAYRDAADRELRQLIALRWAAMDHWFEEDEEVYVHPRDPYKRIDILESSRHVQVAIDGITVADSRRPKLLFETGLPTRHYLPKTDVRLDLLEASDLTTDCPYKGTARYWSVVTDNTTENIVWSYPHPVRESHPIAGMMAFYNEKVDLWIDGVRQERPASPFS